MKALMKFTTPSACSFVLTIALTFCILLSRAQTSLNGSYVATKINYLNGDELQDDNLLKYTYVKYTFSNGNQMAISGVYYENGSLFSFVINEDHLVVKSAAGAVMNTMKILERTDNRLVLVNGSVNGSLDDLWAIKYTLYKEEYVQSKMPLSSDDIFSINKTDTVFKSGQKVYAQFKGPSFQSYIYEKIRDRKKDVKIGELLSTFIVDENGHVDSLRIIQGINPKYDAEYVKAFNTAKNMWQPARINGKTVKVLMNQSLKYFTTEQAMPSYFSGQKANIAFKNQDYETALFYYDQALKARGDEVEHLYRRGICKKMLGNLAGACADWTKIRELGKHEADELLSKYCK